MRGLVPYRAPAAPSAPIAAKSAPGREDRDRIADQASNGRAQRLADPMSMDDDGEANDQAPDERRSCGDESRKRSETGAIGCRRSLRSPSGAEAEDAKDRQATISSAAMIDGDPAAASSALPCRRSSPVDPLRTKRSRSSSAPFERPASSSLVGKCSRVAITGRPASVRMRTKAALRPDSEAQAKLVTPR